MLPRPFVGSFGVISNDGIPKPNFWAFKLLSSLYSNRLALPDTGEVDAGAFTDGTNVQVLLTPQSGDYSEHNKYTVHLSFDFVASDVMVQRIDDEHCNPKYLWQQMGSPDNLTRAEVETIKAQSRLVAEPLSFIANEGKTTLSITLRTNDVALITVKA